MIQLKKFGEVCDFVRGPFGGSLKKSYFVEEGYAVYEQKHAIYDQFSEIRYFVDEDKFNEMKRFELKPNDLIMSCSGTMGKVAIVPENVKRGIINQALLKLTPKDFLDVHYLKYWMSSPDFDERIKENTVGAAIKNVASVKVLKQIDVPIAKLEEQKQIVAILDKAFTAIDQAKANIEKNIENAKELFQSKLNDIFSQKGEGWEEKALVEVCEKTKNIKWQDFSIEEFEYVDLSSVSRETLSVTETATVNKENAPSRAKKIILEGDVIFATTRPTLRRATIIEKDLSGNLCSTGYVVLRPKENISSDWIFFYLLTSKFMDRMESLQRGASYPAVSDNDVKGSKLSVPISTLEEKKNILIMNNLQESTNFLIDNYINKLNDLEELKKSILQKAFAGELTENIIENEALMGEEVIGKYN
jgi:type I restriction enzyme S subunit